MSAPQADEQHGADLAALTALVAAQAASRAQLTRQAVAIATASARSFTGWYDSAQVTDWATQLAGRIEPLQRMLTQSTDAYLARAMSMISGGRVRPAGRVDVAGLRAGITHAGAYGRAADAYRWQQSRFDHFAGDLAAATVTDGRARTVVPHDQGDLTVDVEPIDLSEPVDAAVQRVAAVADADMQLADRAQSQQSMAAQSEKLDIRAYRRVIHPELSKGGTCGLCIAASDRIYFVDDLRAIHDKCECTTLPIIGSRDPGSGLNNLDLKTLYADAGGSTGREALKRTRYKIDEHGELGPVLTPGKFRSERQAKRATRRPGVRKTPEQARADVERVLSLELSAHGKAHELADANPAKWGAYAQKLDARIADLRHQLATVL